MSSEQITVTVVGPSTNATITSGTQINVTLGDVGPINWSEVAGKPTTFPPQAHSHAISDVTGLTAALAQKVELDPYGKVLASQLPSYVDDVLEFANLAALPATGETGKIYVTTNNGSVYRWSGTTYIEISAAPGSTDFVPEGTTNLYHTTARAAAAAPVQSVAGKTGAVSLVKADVGLGNVDNTADASKPVSTAQAAADAAVASAAAADATSKANAAQAAAMQRANHTGTQAISTVSGLQTALDGKAGTADSRLSDAREWSAATIDQAEAEAGTGTTRRAFTAQRVFQAVAAWWAGSAAAAKLAGIATGATANATDAQLRDRSTHTGTQAAGTITGLAAIATSGSAGDLASGTVPIARIPTGSTSSTVCIGNDARLSDARTPTAGSVTDASITSGGLSTSSLNWAAIQPWAANTAYAKGDLVSNAGIAYRRSAAGTSGATFNVANWQQITPTDFVASQIASGTIARARYSADLGTGSMTVSGSNSHGVSLDTTARTLTQANTLAIMGGPVGIGTLTPLATGGLEVAAANNTGAREILRVRNTTAGATGTLDIGVGTSGYFADQAIFAVNGTVAMRFLNSPAGQVVFPSSLRMPNNSQIMGDSNANAYVEMNNGAGQLSLSSVSVMSFQRSYVEVGRWDTNSVWNVGTGHASAASSGGASVTGTQARVRFPGQISTAAGQFAAAGDAQASRYHLRRSTTDATATTLFRDGAATRITIPAQSCWAFKIRLSAYNSTDGIGAAWVIDGGIRRDNAGNTVLLGTPAVTQFADTAMASATVAVTADDTNEALQVNVTGLAGKTIRWHAVVETSEVSAGTPS